MKELRLSWIIVLILVSFYPLDLFAEHPMSERIRQRSTFRGAVLSDLRMKSMMFAFQLQNRPQLEQLLNDQQNPRSPSYHRWVTPAEFGKRFGVSPERYQSAVEWLQVQGFTVKAPLDSRLRIYFEGYARDVQRAFGVNMGWYEYQGKTYYSNDQPPGMPPELQNQGEGIYGLDNFPKEHPLYRVGLRDYLAPLDAQAGY